LVIKRNGSGNAWCDFERGAVYEGPPGHVHGGVAALVVDQVLVEAGSDGVNPRLTGTITVRYVQATRLGSRR